MNPDLAGGDRRMWSTRQSRRVQLLVQWSPVVFLLAAAITADCADVMATVLATPNTTTPNSWVKLECTFNLEKDDTFLVYWSDKNSNTLYLYEKPNGTNSDGIVIGDHYLQNGSDGIIKDVNFSSGYTSAMLFVRCNLSPYTCYIWNHTIEYPKPLTIEVIGTPEPEVKQDLTGVIIITAGIYRFSCKITQATEAHNLTMMISVNNAPVTDGGKMQSSDTYDNETCTYTTEVNEMLKLALADEISVKCLVEYDMGLTFSVTTTEDATTSAIDTTISGDTTDAMTAMNTTMSMNSGQSQDLPSWVIIVLVIVLVLSAVGIGIVAFYLRKSRSGQQSAKSYEKRIQQLQLNHPFWSNQANGHQQYLRHPNGVQYSTNQPQLIQLPRYQQQPISNQQFSSQPLRQQQLSQQRYNPAFNSKFGNFSQNPTYPETKPPPRPYPPYRIFV